MAPEEVKAPAIRHALQLNTKLWEPWKIVGVSLYPHESLAFF